jgi:hypothetical protein
VDRGREDGRAEEPGTGADDDPDDGAGGLLGPWAYVFDTISHEYGWDDDRILDTTVGRLGQIIAAIERRRESDDRLRRSELSWQTRSLAQMIAMTTPYVDMDGRVELYELATTLNMDTADTDPGPFGESPQGEGVEGVDWYWVRGEKVPLKVNSDAAVAHIASGIVRERR